jgi:hypothetical protein
LRGEGDRIIDQYKPEVEKSNLKYIATVPEDELDNVMFVEELAGLCRAV